MVVEKQLLNTIYLKQRKGFDDKLMLVIKDNKTGEKSVKVISDPKINWYVTKPEYWLEQPVSQIEISKTNKKTSLFRNLLSDMAKELGADGNKFFKECIKSGQFNRLKELHYEPNFHGTDNNIEDQYISKYVRKYGQPDGKITKSYFDIEVNISPSSGWAGGFPDEEIAEAPINAITIFFEQENRCLTFLLRDERNPLIQQLEDNLEPLHDRLTEYFRKEFNSEHQFEFYFYDEEIELIGDFMSVIHDLKPDFAAAYNMKFDILTIINRISNLGYDPEDFFCHEDFPYRYMYYHNDTRNDDFSDKGDYFKASSYTNFVDLLLSYASIRKTAGKEDSYKLNDIAQKVIGKGKYEMGEGITIANFPDKDYEGFVFYNIVDVMILHFLEKKNEDINLLYNLSMLTESRFNKALTKTVCLKNYVNVVYNEKGLVLSNNKNVSYGSVRHEKSTEKFRGAFVANPALNTDGIVIDGLVSRFIFENVIDYDYSSLYPYVDIVFNIDATTQIGKIEIVDDLGFNELTNAPVDGSDFCGHLVSQDYMNIGNTYFNLQLPSEITKDIRNGKYSDILDEVA